MQPFAPKIIEPLIDPPRLLPQPSRRRDPGNTDIAYGRAEVTIAALYAGGGWWRGLRAFTVAQWRRAAELLPLRPRPLGAECGALLYQLARAADVRLAVSLGAGDAASILWLACALRANRRASGDRCLIACEPEPGVALLARQRLRQAGLSRYVDLRQAPPQRALARIDQPVDCLLLDGYPAQMLEVLRQLRPHLRPGALVLARCPRRAGRAWSDYLRHVRAPSSGFSSAALPCGEAVELSVRD